MRYLRWAARLNLLAGVLMLVAAGLAAALGDALMAPVYAFVSSVGFCLAYAQWRKDRSNG